MIFLITHHTQVNFTIIIHNNLYLELYLADIYIYIYRHTHTNNSLCYSIHLITTSLYLVMMLFLSWGMEYFVLIVLHKQIFPDDLENLGSIFF
jgi:hypothetical protein